MPNASFKKSAFLDVNFTGSFARADFSCAQFQEVSLSGALFKGASFKYAKLTPTLGRFSTISFGTLVDADFTHARLNGVELSGIPHAQLQMVGASNEAVLGDLLRAAFPDRPDLGERFAGVRVVKHEGKWFTRDSRVNIPVGKSELCGG